MGSRHDFSERCGLEEQEEREQGPCSWQCDLHLSLEATGRCVPLQPPHNSLSSKGIFQLTGAMAGSR